MEGSIAEHWICEHETRSLFPQADVGREYTKAHAQSSDFVGRRRTARCLLFVKSSAESGSLVLRVAVGSLVRSSAAHDRLRAPCQRVHAPSMVIMTNEGAQSSVCSLGGHSGGRGSDDGP